MFELTEPQKMIEQMMRQWCEKELAPNVEKLEKQEINPFDLMRNMLDAFGIRDAQRKALKKKIEKLRKKEAGEEVKEDKSDVEHDPMEAAQQDMMMAMIMIKEICRIAPGFAMSFGVSTALCGGPIVAKGTANQLEKFGLPVACLDKVGCWALTEPGAGSDAFGSMKTVAKPDGDGYIINGSKTFITNGPYGEIFLTYAKIDRGQPKEEQRVHAFILEKGMEGFTIGKPFQKMGMKDSPTSDIFMDDVRVTKEHLLGTEKEGGKDEVKEGMGTERTGVPAMCLGIIEKCLEQSIQYAKERYQFKRRIADFQAIQLRIADMYLKYTNVQSIVYRLAWMANNKKNDMAYISATKAYCAQAALAVAEDAIQIHGGYGYMQEYHIEKLMRDAKLLELGAGTTDINLLTAARILLQD